MAGDPVGAENPKAAAAKATAANDFEAAVRSLVAPFLASSEPSSEHGTGPAPPLEVARLSGGASRRTWTIRTPATSPDLILQVARGGATPMEWQARVMSAARRVGVRVPEVISAGPDPGGLGGDHLLTVRVEGESIPRRILRDPAFAAARRTLTGELGEALARIHTVDPGAGPDGAPDRPDELTFYTDILAGLPTPYPALELVAVRLARTRPDPAPATLVHGDFRMGNLLVTPEGLAGVLDWELAHPGDPREDLGWLCVRAWRFGGEGRVAGVGSRSELLAAYHAAGGAAFTEGELDWWEALGTFRWGVICAVQGSRHLSGSERSHELAAVGRRVCENEWDLLETIAPAEPSEMAEIVDRARRAVELTTGPDRVPPAVDGAGALHSGPDARQLLHAVRHWLAEDLGPELEGRSRFHARVAANIVAQVERELVLGLSRSGVRAERLADLGVADGAELARVLRDGTLDPDDPAVLTAVRADVVDRLLVANPRYLIPRGG